MPRTSTRGAVLCSLVSISSLTASASPIFGSGNQASAPTGISPRCDDNGISVDGCAPEDGTPGFIAKWESVACGSASSSHGIKRADVDMAIKDICSSDSTFDLNHVSNGTYAPIGDENVSLGIQFSFDGDRDSLKNNKQSYRLSSDDCRKGFLYTWDGGECDIGDELMWGGSMTKATLSGTEAYHTYLGFSIAVIHTSKDRRGQAVTATIAPPRYISPRFDNALAARATDVPEQGPGGVPAWKVEECGQPSNNAGLAVDDMKDVIKAVCRDTISTITFTPNRTTSSNEVIAKEKYKVTLDVEYHFNTSNEAAHLSLEDCESGFLQPWQASDCNPDKKMMLWAGARITAQLYDDHTNKHMSGSSLTFQSLISSSSKSPKIKEAAVRRQEQSSEGTGLP